jgi:hypothetical protein
VRRPKGVVVKGEPVETSGWKMTTGDVSVLYI